MESKKGHTGSISGQPVGEKRKVTIVDIESKERMEVESVTACARHFNMRIEGINFYIKRKVRRKHNGRKYAIRYTSSLKPTQND